MDLSTITPEILSAAQRLLIVHGDAKTIRPEIERWQKAIEDARTEKAAADTALIAASQRKEQAEAAERRAREAQEKLDRDRAQHRREAEAYDARVARETSDATTARVAVEQREAAAKVLETRLAADRVEIEDQSRKLAEALAQAESAKALYDGKIAELRRIVG